MEIKKVIFLLITVSVILALSATITITVKAEVDKSENAVNQISIGTQHFLVKGRDGTVWSAGYNSEGQLGRTFDGVFDDIKLIPSVTEIGGISTGSFSSYGINKKGQVLDWHRSSSTSESVFSSLKKVKTVAEGANFYAVLTIDGKVWTWGTGYIGQLGLGDNESRSVPTIVPDLDKVTEIAVGKQSVYALKEDGTVWGWGDNKSYQLANGGTDNSLVPVQVEIPMKIKHIYQSLNGYSAAIDVNNDVWMWGSNSYGQLGDGTKTVRKSPEVSTNLSSVEQLALGKSHVLALKIDGSVWAWGNNANGQLGDNTTEERLLPIQIPGLSEVDSIAAGNGFISGAVSKTSQIYIWGQDVRSMSDMSLGRLTSPRLITIDDQPKVISSIEKPANLKLKVINTSSVQLSWDKLKEQYEQWDGYNVYQNNVMIGNTKENNFIINNLDVTKEYSFFVKTKGTSGNESEASNNVRKRKTEKYSYIYNFSGQLTDILFESGKKISYEYDKNGNLKKTTVVNP
ncbi:hypothetical protein PAEAM_14250 [Paenibacillus sp. GM1FR]|uniref:RCC1 domain-containing protein n=1 Tax=Paenibacillus sp. GM1FR TaxID=2059267 RepID=UPI000C27C6DE|nr:hypothetical protein [Paenibacillus sp. GM1FR]PJN61863.1 hypothetical protein PAEAM_14250 [Paenibacillus sp. GM1FR]